MRAELLPIQIRDLEMIFHWRNHESVAKWSAGTITMDDHWQWFLNSKNTFRWVFYLDGSPAGFVKFEPESGCYRWSFYLNPFEIYNKGTGSIMLTMALSKFGHKTIIAECHKDNIASLRLHEKLGFKESETNDPQFRSFVRWQQS